MTLRDVVDTFILDFEHDLPQRLTPPELPNFEEAIAGAEYQFSKSDCHRFYGFPSPVLQASNRKLAFKS